MGLALDGYGQNAGGGNSASGTVMLTTANAADLIVLIVFAEGASKPGFPYSISSVSGAGLTWTKRKAFTSSNGGGQLIEIWYAQAAAILSSQTITFTFSATLDDFAAFAFGVSGYDTTTPWTTNVSLPATNSASASSDPSVSGCSTSEANTMMIAAAGSSNSGNFSSGSDPSGWSSLGTPPSTINGNLAAEAIGAYQLETSAQTNLTVTFQTAVTNWVAIVDAIRAAPVNTSRSAAPLVVF